MGFLCISRGAFSAPEILVRKTWIHHKQKEAAVCAHTDIYRNGDCRDCDRQRTARYRKRRKLGMALLHAVEERGLSGTEAIAALKYIDYWTLQDCQEAWHSSTKFKAVANAEW